MSINIFKVNIRINISHIKPRIITGHIFLSLNLPKYIEETYIVVSVAPNIIERAIPRDESTPIFFNTSIPKLIPALPENDLIIDTITTYLILLIDFKEFSL